MTLKAKERQWWKEEDWSLYLKRSDEGGGDQKAQQINRDYYNYNKGVEKIRDLTDSEYHFAKAYDKEILGIR